MLVFAPIYMNQKKSNGSGERTGLHGAAESPAPQKIEFILHPHKFSRVQKHRPKA